MHPAPPQKHLWNGSRNVTKLPRRWRGIQIPQIPIQSNICGTCQNKSDPWRHHLADHRTQRICLQCPGARQHRICVLVVKDKRQVRSTMGSLWIKLVTAHPLDDWSVWALGILEARLPPWALIHVPSVGWWCVSSGILINARTQGFPTEHTVTRGPMLLASPVCPFNGW